MTRQHNELFTLGVYTQQLFTLGVYTQQLFTLGVHTGQLCAQWEQEVQGGEEAWNDHCTAVCSVVLCLDRTILYLESTVLYLDNTLDR